MQKMRQVFSWVKRKRGFTLMETLISLVVLSILLGIIGIGLAGTGETKLASSGVEETQKLSDVARKWYNKDLDGDNVPDGNWPTIAQIQGSYYPGWNGNNPWGNPYTFTVSSEGILTITQTVPEKFVKMYTNRLAIAVATGNSIAYHVPPPGSYTENEAFVHRVGDTMEEGALLEWAGSGGYIEGLRNPDEDGELLGSDAVNVNWYDDDVQERLQNLQEAIENGTVIAGHASWADDAAHANLADRSLRTDWADSAGDALRALYANNAGHANDADNADYANSAGRADRATRADNADHADKADYADVAKDVINKPPQPTGTPGGGSDWSASAATTGDGELRITINNNSSSSLSFSIRFGSPFSTTKTLTIAKNSHGTTSVGGCDSNCSSYNVTATVTCTKDSSKKTLTGTAKKRTGSAG